ncbi:MAG: hypothetical protein ACFCU6_05295, partial [Balneolaceae bacterium]
GSYPAFSPLPPIRHPTNRGGLFSVALSVPAKVNYRTFLLGSTALVGVRTFLPDLQIVGAITRQHFKFHYITKKSGIYLMSLSK